MRQLGIGLIALAALLAGLSLSARYFAEPLPASLLSPGGNLVGSQRPDFSLGSHEGELVTQEDFSGKTLLVNFWATWCAPCMQELPHAKQLKTMFDKNDVVFVYLANRSGVIVWEKTIAERDIQGDHYLLTETQYSNMSKTFEFSGIPHYVLIDRKGNIVSKDAPRPSSGDVIINSIKELL